MNPVVLLTYLAIVGINVAHGLNAHYKTDAALMREWEAFKTKHGKSYQNEHDENNRLNIFVENKRIVDEHNARAQNGLVGYTLAINKYSDLSADEFNKQMNGLIVPKGPLNGTRYAVPHGAVVGSEVDWRPHGLVTPVKNQGECGSCWAFSTTGALEGQHSKKSGQLVSLSEQNLIDCDRLYNKGCNGGLPIYAYLYIQLNGGVDQELAYPYEEQDSVCRFSRAAVGAQVTGAGIVQQGDEELLKAAVATVGPISVGINAKYLQQYAGGVFDFPLCTADEINHAVLVVGYGTAPTGQEYWLVKNSWGTEWGMGGYVMMARNKDNQCGIASMATYPVV